jgi:hypothetical protein
MWQLNLLKNKLKELLFGNAYYQLQFFNEKNIRCGVVVCFQEDVAIKNAKDNLVIFANTLSDFDNILTNNFDIQSTLNLIQVKLMHNNICLGTAEIHKVHTGGIWGS